MSDKKPYWVFKTQDACHAAHCYICTNQWRWWCNMCDRGRSVQTFKDAFSGLSGHHQIVHPDFKNFTKPEMHGRLLTLLNQWHNGPGETNE